jgi:hypothetical protein
MNHFSLPLTAAVVLALSPCGWSLESDDQAAARKIALDLAGAFSNDGFKLRDGHWSGPLEIGKAQIIQVNLYAGNQYWFSAGATSQAKTLSVTLYDEAGKPMVVDSYNDEGKAAAGFSPEASGPYYVQIKEVAGAASTFCLIYSYK